MKAKTKFGWHFVEGDWTLRYDLSGTVVKVGQTVTVDDNLIQPYKYGLHASAKILNALSCFPTSNLCLVELGGKVIVADDTIVGEKRTVLAMADITPTLHRFGLWCGEQILALDDNPDPRSLRAIEVKKRWIEGEASDKEMRIANKEARAVIEEKLVQPGWAYAETRTAQMAWAKASAANVAALASEWATDAAFAAASIATIATMYAIVVGAVEWTEHRAHAIARSSQNAKLTAMVLELPQFEPFKGIFLP